jgi:hypothetical protein
VQIPEIHALNPQVYAPGPRLAELPTFRGLEVHPQKMPAGPAGKGPKPPKPPSILDDKKAIGIPGAGGGGGKAEDELMLDAEDEPSSVDKIMMFAKMDLPPKFLENEANQRLEDDFTDDFKMTTDMEEPSAVHNSIDPSVGAPSASGPAASKPAPANKVSKQASIGQVTRQGTRKGQSGAVSSSNSVNNSSVGSNGSKGSGKKGTTPGPTVIKVVKKPPIAAVPPVEKVPLLPEATQTMELELKKPVPIVHGPKDKIPNFFETTEFLKQVRQPHLWTSDGRFESGHGQGGPPAAQAAESGKSLGEKASELGLWS